MKTLQTVIAATLLIMSFSVYADYTIDKGAIRKWRAQDVVITLGQDPVQNTEVACLALTLGQFLRGAGEKVNVTLFLRNDGVSLADSTTVNAVTELCQVPNPNEDPEVPGDEMMEIPLWMNLEAFLAGNQNNLVNCPICWIARVASGIIGDPDHDYGVMDPNVIPELLLGADKVIDF